MIPMSIMGGQQSLVVSSIAAYIRLWGTAMLDLGSRVPGWRSRNPREVSTHGPAQFANLSLSDSFMPFNSPVVTGEPSFGTRLALPPGKAAP